MSALIWWSIPAAAFILVVIWVAFKNRPKPPVDPHDSMAEHLRFQRAMQRQTEAPRQVQKPAEPDV